MGITTLRSVRLSLLALIGFILLTQNASGVVLYRIGSPFSAVEKDSLENIGIDFKEINWSAAQLTDALETDSLAAGSLQPNFFAEDEDIAASLLDRGGWVKVEIFASENNLVGKVLIDKDPTTSYSWSEIETGNFVRIRREKTTFNLGGQFLIREVKLRPLAEKPEHFLERLTLGSSPPFSAFRTPTFPTLVEIKENTEPDISIPIDPPITTSFVQLVIIRESPKEVGLAAFEIFGGGFVSQSSYESDVIKLDDNASWGQLRWKGRQDPGARVDIRTRTGTDPQPNLFWALRTEQQDSIQYLQGGGDLSLTEYKKRYDKIEDDFKPTDSKDWISVDTENWSYWSSPYLFENSGNEIVSPGPRQYFQVKADFLSTVDAGGKIDYIEFSASVPPAVRSVIAEISPIETTVGEPTHFTYYIKPTIRSGDSGFNGVEITTPSGVISIDSLRLDGVNQDNFTSTIKANGLGFEIVLPRKLEPTDSGALIEVVFNALVLREVGTLFNAKIFDTTRPNEIRQQINPGNAADEVEGDLLSVKTSLTRSLLFSPQIAPNPFTPNNDNINDTMTLSYTLLRVTAPIPITIKIFDLSGQLVKHLYNGNDSIGEYTHSWDGKDNFNKAVAPGIYLYQITADLQSGQEIQNGIVSIVY